MKKEGDLVEVFSGETWKAAIVKEILEGSGINTITENELMGSIAPWYVSPGGVAPIIINVLYSEFEKAKELVRGFMNNLEQEDSGKKHSDD